MIRTDDGKDIVDDLRRAIENGLRHAATGATMVGTADSDVNVLVRTVSLALLERAIAEIQFLRGMAGAVTQGESHREIKGRTVTTIAELEAILKEDISLVRIHPDGTVTREPPADIADAFTP